MSHTLRWPPSSNPRFPRVSGDEPDQAARAIGINKFSPRERG